MYRVKRDDGEGSKRMSHCNHLIPVVWPVPVKKTATDQHKVLPTQPRQPQISRQPHVSTVKKDSSSEEYEKEEKVLLEVHSHIPAPAIPDKPQPNVS